MNNQRSNVIYQSSQQMVPKKVKISDNINFQSKISIDESKVDPEFWLRQKYEKKMLQEYIKKHQKPIKKDIHSVKNYPSTAGGGSLTAKRNNYILRTSNNVNTRKSTNQNENFKIY